MTKQGFKVSRERKAVIQPTACILVKKHGKYRKVFIVNILLVTEYIID